MLPWAPLSDCQYLPTDFYLDYTPVPTARPPLFRDMQLTKYRFVIAIAPSTLAGAKVVNNVDKSNCWAKMGIKK